VDRRREVRLRIFRGVELPPPVTVRIPGAGWLMVRYDGFLPVGNDTAQEWFPQYRWLLMDARGTVISSSERDGRVRGGVDDGEDTTAAVHAILAFLAASAEEYGLEDRDERIFSPRVTEWAHVHSDEIGMALHELEMEEKG
jgi:hypothetical protein